MILCPLWSNRYNREWAWYTIWSRRVDCTVWQCCSFVIISIWSTCVTNSPRAKSMKMARLPKNAAFAVVCLLHLLILSGQWQSTSAISSSSVSSSVTGAVAGGNSSENVLQTAETSSPGTTGGPVGTKRTCSNVHSIFEQRGFNTANMPTDPVTGECRYLSFTRIDKVRQSMRLLYSVVIDLPGWMCVLGNVTTS